MHTYIYENLNLCIVSGRHDVPNIKKQNSDMQAMPEGGRIQQRHTLHGTERDDQSSNITRSRRHVYMMRSLREY